MAPLDLGPVGDVVDKATDAVVGAATTAADKASGAVSTATAAAGDIKNQAEDTAGMLAMFKKIQDWIDLLEKYWNDYKNLIIFVVCLVIFIYVASLLYCCYHFCHDFCRCAGCYLKCTWRTEEFIRKRGWKCARYCCRTCGGIATNHRGEGGESKREYHKCSNCCLAMIPRSTRIDLEKQHGDLRKGWSDHSYLARACGRYALPDDPVERAKWHWWGHEEQRRAPLMISLFPCGIDKQKRIESELKLQKDRDRFYDNLKDGAERLSERANLGWAARKGHVKKMLKKTREEKQMVAIAEERLQEMEAMKRSSSDSERSVVEDEVYGEKSSKGKS